jgi:hypothetical protein
MGFFDTLANAATSGLAGQIVGVVEKYFPPAATPEQKAALELAAENMELQRANQFAAAQSTAEKDLNERIAMYEGTASDLKAIPILGAFMLLLRGSQRPIWGFATLWIDFQVFSGVWKLVDPIESNAFWIINLLVLGFLFGERAITNIMPFVTNMIKVQKGGN